MKLKVKEEFEILKESLEGLPEEEAALKVKAFFVDIATRRVCDLLESLIETVETIELAKGVGVQVEWQLIDQIRNSLLQVSKLDPDEDGDDFEAALKTLGL